MTRARDVANIDGLLTTTGDTYYASAAGTPARLGIGSTSQVLTVSGGVPAWATPAGGGSFSWTSYTPTYGAGIVVGNGTVSSAYVDTGAEVWFWFHLVCGSTTAIGNGATISIPVNVNTTNFGFYYNPTTLGVCYDASASKMYGGIIGFSSASSCNFTPFVASTAGEFGVTEMNANVPFTWATGDKLSFLIHYRKA